MSWAIALWAAYGVFTILVFGAAWFGLRYLQKALLSENSNSDD